jgi:iron only hydrogenase large subunit-like protein
LRAGAPLSPIKLYGRGLSSSGCITSTESLLITLQSHLEVRTFINNSIATVPADEPITRESRRPFLSISPQTLASLSAYHSALTSRPALPLSLVLRRIRSFLSAKERGEWVVGDTTFARHLSLRESVAEFEERRAYAKGKWVDRSGGATEEGGYTPGPLPILASACPGWVCYAEKAQGDLLPLMSSVRSSQGVSGALVKQYWGGKAGLR